MAIKYNGTSPTAIKYNGTDLTVVKYGSTSVWGKPYSLSISAGSNTSVTVTRTSSPNQHASTGTLSSGSVIYYGDVITVSYSVSSGYKISTATVNGSTFTSGASFTVTSAVSVVTTAEVSASWHTVWTGKTSINKSGTSINISVTGLVSTAQKTRVTFNGKYIYNMDDYNTGASDIINTNFTIDAKELACGVAGKDKNTIESWDNQSDSYKPSGYNAYCYAKSVSGNNIIFARTSGEKYSDDYSSYISYAFSNVYLTKVEQYY